MTIEKPPCYGQPALSAKSPCHQCGVLAACSRRFTQLNPFGLLMWPRIAAPAAAGGVELPAPMLFDPSIVAAWEAEMARSSGLVAGAKYVWRHKRERVLVLREASAARVAVEFMNLSVGRLASMRTVRSGAVQVSSSGGGAARGEHATVGEIAQARALAPNSVAWAPEWRSIAQVSVEVAHAVYHGGSSE